MSSPDPKNKRWVYKCLVQGENDFVGLIAYSLYKKRKTDIAEQHRANGCAEDVIKAKISAYHEMVVTGDADIERFRREAGALLEAMMSNTAEAITKEHEKKREDLVSQHGKELAKARKQVIDNLAKAAKDSQNQDLHWLKKLGFWLFSGVPSGAATILLTILTLGVIAVFSDPEDKGKFAAGVVNKAAGGEIVQPAAPK